MKIYKPKDVIESTTDFDFIDLLINNELPLESKMLNLSGSYEKLKLTPLAIEKILENLLAKHDFIVEYPRRGDNNTRYDAKIYDKEGILGGVVEVEVPSTAMLDAPRNLLDDIAVICNREDIDITNIIPLVICWTYPNKRTDYWNVIEDINKILNIKIKTISIMSLAVMYWLDFPLDLNSDMFYLTPNNYVLDEIIMRLKEENVEIGNFEGYFSPFK